MSDNPVDGIPSFDRISIRAVVVYEGQDPSEAISEAGIIDPVALPIIFGEDKPAIGFGDGITPNLTAVVEPDQAEDDFDDFSAQPVDAQRGEARQTGSGTTSLPPAYGTQSLAPIRQRQPSRPGSKA